MECYLTNDILIIIIIITAIIIIIIIIIIIKRCNLTLKISIQISPTKISVQSDYYTIIYGYRV